MSLTPYAKREYKRLRRNNWPAKEALRAARIRDRFTDLEAEDCVRIVCEPECELYDDSYLECQGLTPRQIEHVRKELWERIERTGYWMYASEYRDECGVWQSVDAIGSFIGDDFKDSGYDIELMKAAIDAYEESVFRAGLAGTG